MTGQEASVPSQRDAVALLTLHSDSQLCTLPQKGGLPEGADCQLLHSIDLVFFGGPAPSVCVCACACVSALVRMGKAEQRYHMTGGS